MSASLFADLVAFQNALPADLRERLDRVPLGDVRRAIEGAYFRVRETRRGEEPTNERIVAELRGERY
jgi:hypothetical protein